ncbi:MAG: GAF domain-containing sensor histidine kinase [Oligoflexia bacterium]|nr:GAF domain-containing sensor histidine kinase [Oligoflexia bacterium]
MNQDSNTLRNTGLFDLVSRIETARSSASFLAKAAHLAPLGTDLHLTFSRWARMTIPYLADWCFIDLLDDEGRLHQVASAFHDTEERSFDTGKQVVRAQFAPLPAQLRDILEKKRTVKESPVSSGWVGDLFASVIPPNQMRSVLVVPMQAYGKTSGLVTWIITDPDRSFPDGCIKTAEELAYRMSIVRENTATYHASQEALISRDEFISIASHELKNPLTALKLQIQLLKRTIRNAPSDSDLLQPLKRITHTIDQSADRLSESMDRLLDMAKIRSGQLDISRHTMDLNNLIQDVAKCLQPALANSGCELKLLLMEKVIGNWDYFRLSQVVTNLIINATKYAANEPIQVRLKRVGNEAVLSVKDHGPGIPKEEQHKIFGRFEKARETRNSTGLGLGLYICQKIVQLHGGEIGVESEPGQGAQFTVKLPI